MDIGFFFAIVIWVAVIVTAFILLFLIRNRMRRPSQLPKNKRTAVQDDEGHVLEKTITVVIGLFVLSFASAFITVITLINLDHGQNPLLLNRVWLPAAFMLNTFVFGLIAFVLGRASASNRKVQTVRSSRQPPPLQAGTKREIERLLPLFQSIERLKYEAQS